MSLRGFHLVFIAIAALFSAAIGVFVVFFEAQASMGVKIFGVAAFAAAIALIVYGVSFYRKAKNLSL